MTANNQCRALRGGTDPCLRAEAHPGKHEWQSQVNEQLQEIAVAAAVEQEEPAGANGGLPKYNRASHYERRGAIECIDAIRSALSPEEFRGYCKGNVIKYVWRERFKGGNADLEKALDYMRWALE